MSRVLLMASTRKGAFFLESDRDRTEWTVRGPAFAGWDVADLLLDDRGQPRLFAAVGHFVYGATIHRSDDLGETWEQVPAGPSYPEDAEDDLNQIWTLVRGPQDEPEVLFAGVDEAGLFVSTDGGSHWEERHGLRGHESRDHWFPGKGGLCCHSILQHPDDPDRLWVGISAVGVFRSDDGGDSWEAKNDGLDIIVPDDERDDIGTCVHRLVLDPSDSDRLYQQNHRGTFRSTDGADSWERIDDGLPSTFGFPIAVHPTDGDTVFTVPLESDESRMFTDGEPAIYRSTDAGDGWERLDRGLPSDCWTAVMRQALVTDDLDPVGVYVGTTGGRIFHSTDTGDTWKVVDSHLPRINSLAVTTI